MMQYGVACWLVGRRIPRIPILAAEFAYPEPARSAEYHWMYSEQLRFSESATSLMFDRSYLELPVIQNQCTIKEFVRGAPVNIVLKDKNSTGFSVQIRPRLRAAARTEWPDFDALSQRAFKKWTGARPGEYRQRMHAC